MTAQTFAFKMARGNKEWVRLPGSRRARVGPLGLALLDFLGTDLTDATSQEALWKRWRVAAYERPGYLSPRLIRETPLEHLLEEQRWLRLLAGMWLFPAAPGAPRAAKTITYKRLIELLGERRAQSHGKQFREELERQGLALLFQSRPPMSRIPIAERPAHTESTLPESIANLRKWRRAHSGDFFGLLWWELDQACRRELPARQCQLCGSLFILAHGNERYCVMHKNSRSRKQAQRKRDRESRRSGGL